MIGFKFNGIHSSEFNIGVKSVDRTVLPEKRRREYIVPGISGTLEFESEEYEKRQITMQIGIMKTENWYMLREKVRELAEWMSGYGLLIFDDEPHKAYKATVYDPVGLEQLKLSPRGISELIFECQPFSESVELNRVVVQNVSEDIEIQNKGNVKTCGTIIIKNSGSKAIENIQITRKVVI